MRGTRREGPGSQAGPGGRATAGLGWAAAALEVRIPGLQQMAVELETQAEQQPLPAECLPWGRSSAHTDLFHLHGSLCIWRYYPHLTDGGTEKTEVQGVEQTAQVHNHKRQVLDVSPGLSIPCACATPQLSVSRRSSLLAPPLTKALVFSGPAWGVLLSPPSRLGLLRHAGKWC